MKGKKLLLFALVIALVLAGCKKEEITHEKAYKILLAQLGYPLPVYAYLPVGDYTVVSASAKLNKIMEAEIELMKKLQQLGYIQFKVEKSTEPLEGEEEAGKGEEVDLTPSEKPEGKELKEKTIYHMSVSLTEKAKKSWKKVADVMGDESTIIPERIMVELPPEVGLKTTYIGSAPLDRKEGAKKLFEIWKVQIGKRILTGARLLEWRKGGALVLVQYRWKYAEVTDMFKPIKDYFKAIGGPDYKIDPDREYIGKVFLSREGKNWKIVRKI